MTKIRAQKSISLHSDTKTTKDFRDWLPREKLEELIEKSKSESLTLDEKRILIEDMSYFGCTTEDIATLLNTTMQYLNTNFRDVLNRAMVRWRYDLRKAQVKNGFEGNGNHTMLIWLGKQYLAQKDDPQLEVKRDKFDEFIEWMRTQSASKESPQNSEISS